MRSALFCIVLLTASACSMLEPAAPKYVVFFTPGSSQLDGPARHAIADAAARAAANPAAPVNVIGYADSVGTPQDDVLLSQQRSQAVADALVADGVAANRLVRLGRGRSGGDAGLESRRVEITVGS
jgi:outer membrane protein OmpA-like peptidoglycan-associated protein